MIQTERDYVSSLRFIVDNYIPELQREDVPQVLRGKRNVIFGNIEKICQFHQQYFLREVEACRRNIFHIAQYFIMHVSGFLMRNCLFMTEMFSRNSLHLIEWYFEGINVTRKSIFIDIDIKHWSNFHTDIVIDIVRLVSFTREPLTFLTYYYCSLYLYRWDICIAFLSLLKENQFQLYALYNKNKPRSDYLMAENGKHFFAVSIYLE